MTNELNKKLGQKLGNFENKTEAEAQTPILGTYRSRGLGRVLAALLPQLLDNFRLCITKATRKSPRLKQIDTV